MAESSGQLYNTMRQIENQLGTYNLGTAPGAIQKELGKAVQNFQPQYRELGQAESAAYAMPGEVMQDYARRQAGGEFMMPGMQGTQFTGLNPIDALNVGLGRVGSQFALADTIGRGIDFQKGRLEDIAGQIGNQYQLGYQQQLDKYNRYRDLYGLALQDENARKARAASRAQSVGLANMLRSMQQGQGAGMGSPAGASIESNLGGALRAAMPGPRNPFEVGLTGMANQFFNTGYGSSSGRGLGLSGGAGSFFNR